MYSLVNAQKVCCAQKSKPRDHPRESTRRLVATIAHAKLSIFSSCHHDVAKSGRNLLLLAFRVSNVCEPCCSVELGVDSVDLRRGDVDIHGDDALDFVLVGADARGVPSPGDLIARIEVAESLEDWNGWSSSLATDEGLLAWVWVGAELRHNE